MAVGSVAPPFVLKQTNLAFHFIEFPTSPMSVWSFIYRTLHKGYVATSEARQHGTKLIVKAAKITERLGDEITLTEICSDACGVSRSISNVRYCLSRLTGLGCGRITENCIVIDDKLANRYSCKK